MPNIKSAKKRVLISKNKAALNKARKSALKTVLKKFEEAVRSGDKALALAAYNDAAKTVDQSVCHGIIHKNKAAHKKSQMMLKLNAMA